ncbi:ubiquitin-like modifier-activating enzyme 1 [Osmerus eperlanus]|uniref:ubiquitin-like modifier-activating enzyme 1 n=1 Tax=Osmerus eperlanus TaxID=29151 RepID=UPI002E0D6637
MSEKNEIDEGLYSRQLYVLGHDAMRRMGTASVLIAGMRGVGVEIAKNVILSGVKSVTVQDEGLAEWKDLSTQFFLRERHLGQNRALSSLPELSALNPHVYVTAHTAPLDPNLLLKFQVVVLTDSSLEDQLRFGPFCHSNGIKFIVADAKGLSGQLFCDFGEEFEVLDINGETLASAMIDHISKGNPGIVTCSVDQSHGFEDDCSVSFSEIRGMTELNSYGPVDITVLSPYSFSICDTSGLSEYQKGGVATEVKKAQKLRFKSMDEALLDPELLVMTDYGKVDRHQTLHLAFQALHGFVKTQGRLPKPRSQSDAEVLLAGVVELNKVAQLEHLDEAVVRGLSFTASGDLAPVNAFIGGVAAQEVLKACSGKFTPLQQWLYFDAMECLADDHQFTESSCSPRGSRYDGQIAVFGSAFQERLEKQKYFLVGAGAIGCELLKNFALIGLGAGEGGHITVTDMDSIERSNLNRQFLFRPRDIGRQKSEAAAEAVREMNPRVNIEAHQNRVDPDSERVYGRRFFTGLDGVAAALDNVEARVYLDGRCVQHQKPMLEGGTLGSKGHTLVVVPHLTQSYGPAGANNVKAIPLCTLKNFPHRIEHTLQWARDQFEGLFKQPAENVNQYLKDAGFLERTLGLGEAEALEVLDGVWASVGGRRPAGWEDCVSWARLRWETLYNNDIRQLLHCFPQGQLTSSGLPFWSGAKRCPHPLIFDPNNTTHMDYVVAAANLYGQTYGIAGSRDYAAVRKVLEKVPVPDFTPKSTVKIHVTDQEMEEDKEKQIADVDQGRLEELERKLALQAQRSSAMQMHPADFEKDDDSNFHMDFIVAASNLRAENYEIPAADRHKSKLIAGRIIPAIATTTAVVAGLMCVELYKLVLGLPAISSYRSSYINMAVQLFVLSQPCPPRRFTVAEKEYSLWDNFQVRGRGDGQQEMTLGELLSHIKEEYHLEISSLFYGSAVLYDAGPAHQERLLLSVSDVVRKVTKADLPQHLRMLQMFPSFAEDEDCEVVPPIHYLL